LTKRRSKLTAPLTLLLTTLLVGPLAIGIGMNGSPAFAAKGGNGKGGGNGNHGNSGNRGHDSGKVNHGHSAASKTKGSAGEESSSGEESEVAGIPANQLGKLNGFLHASPNALLKTSAKSAIGKISKTYAGQLAGYLAGAALQTRLDDLKQQLADQQKLEMPDQGIIDQLTLDIADLETKVADAPTQNEADLAAAAATLQSASNKPLSPEVIAAVNAKLGTLYGPTDPSWAPYASAEDPASLDLANSIFGQLTPEP
jgi:hypothetical protein